jgi:hypothetical protein
VFAKEQLQQRLPRTNEITSASSSMLMPIRFQSFPPFRPKKGRLISSSGGGNKGEDVSGRSPISDGYLLVIPR